MGTIQRTLVRDAAAIGAAMIAVGASFGAITIAYGLPTWVPFLMSTVVFAGGAQFLAVGLIAAGNPLAAVFAGLLLNARHLPFGLAVSSTIGPRTLDRLVGSHLMTDEVVAFTLAEPDPARRRPGVLADRRHAVHILEPGIGPGRPAGRRDRRPERARLGRGVPGRLIALIMPSLRDRRTRVAALSGAAVAVLLTPILPAGLPVLCALLGLCTLIRPRQTRPKPGSAELGSGELRRVESC